MRRGEPRAALRGELHIDGTRSIAEGWARKYLFERGPGEAPLEILVGRVDGRLFAMHTLCPHEGGRLAEGPLCEGRYPRCPLHLYQFDPESGAAREVECDPATVFRIEEEGDQAVIRPMPPGVGEREPA